MHFVRTNALLALPLSTQKKHYRERLEASLFCFECCYIMTRSKSSSELRRGWKPHPPKIIRGATGRSSPSVRRDDPRQSTNLKSFRRVSRRKPAQGDYKRHMPKTSPERRLRELFLLGSDTKSDRETDRPSSQHSESWKGERRGEPLPTA